MHHSKIRRNKINISQVSISIIKYLKIPIFTKYFTEIINVFYIRDIPNLDLSVIVFIIINKIMKILKSYILRTKTKTIRRTEIKENKKSILLIEA